MSPAEPDRGARAIEALPPLRDVLAEGGVRADKRFGQNFLLDLNICRKIVRLAEVAPGDYVLEVGPGPGGLTRALLEAGASVWAIEKDPRFPALLATLSAVSAGRLTVVAGDALEIAPQGLLPAGCVARIVANLPYNVATPLLVGWLTGPFRPASMTLMFQKEVARRIVAAPASADYGRLSIIVQAVCRARIVMDLPARAFTPPPQVDSAVVHLVPLPERPSDARLSALQTLTAAAFGQRRKMLRTSLKMLGGEALCRAAEIEPDARAETVDVAGFLRLADAWRERHGRAPAADARAASEERI